MARSQYFVVLHDNQWKISFNGQHYGPYTTQQAAIRAAVDAAHSTGQKGHDAQVMVQGLTTSSAQSGPTETTPIRRGDSCNQISRHKPAFRRAFLLPALCISVGYVKYNIAQRWVVIEYLSMVL